MGYETRLLKLLVMFLVQFYARGHLVCTDDTCFFVTSSYCSGLLVCENKKQNSLSFLRKSGSTFINCSFKDAGHRGSKAPPIRVLALKLLVSSVSIFCKSPSCTASIDYQFVYNFPFLQGTE